MDKQNDIQSLLKMINRFVPPDRSEEFRVEVKDISTLLNEFQSFSIPNYDDGYAKYRQELERDNLSRDELVLRLADRLAWFDVVEAHRAALKAQVNLSNKLLSISKKLLEHASSTWSMRETLSEVAADLNSSASYYDGMSDGRDRQQSAFGKKGAVTLDSRPGGSREKREKIRQIWATGKYLKKDVCAEQECAALDMSFSTARKALRNMPNPP